MGKTKRLTGAQAIATILVKEGISSIFAYPGTSELALCDGIEKEKKLRLYNGRGDKESAFMAAGCCLLSPIQAVAILHGTRGLTNALGAIADVNRNEIGTVYLVGLPSTKSQPFLPPHGEENLIGKAGSFAKAFYEVKVVPKTENEEKNILKQIQNVFTQARSLPMGPTLVGLPQDFLETVCFSSTSIDRYEKKLNKLNPLHSDVLAVSRFFLQSKTPLILVDDFLYKSPNAKKSLIQLCKRFPIPIFQITYKRGPMFFEQLHPNECSSFLGMYDPANPTHRDILFSSDLLITLEDRNMYERVVGTLPECRKIIITSHQKMTQKNSYIRDRDLIISSDPTDILNHFISLKSKFTHHFSWPSMTELKKKIVTNKKMNQYLLFQKRVVQEFGRALSAVKNPIVVDDSQMFGGMLAKGYPYYPMRLRVFGDHGAFIGGGLALAVGSAVGNPHHTVFCTLGDQSFLNAIQGLHFICQQKAKIIFVVCNNGESVSLIKQAKSQGFSHVGGSGKGFLSNIADLDYTSIAESFHLTTFRVTLETMNNFEVKFMHLRNVLKSAMKKKGPVFIEIKISHNVRFWEGIWTTQGFENTKQ